MDQINIFVLKNNQFNMKSSRKQKLVSIIINCYNSEKYLRETLNSVLNQTYKK